MIGSDANSGAARNPTLSALGEAGVHSHPWLAPFAPLANRIAQSDASCVADALNRAHPESVRFVVHAALPPNEAYEAFIARTSCVPTRDNLHDLFNGMIWLTFPKTKRHMNRLQAADIAIRGISSSRGALRDALTVFDENGAALQAPFELVEALRRRDWPALFKTHRALWSSARLVLFGHALLEKLMQPRKNITAHVWVLDDLTDDALAASLQPELLGSKAFLPLPVLGVPGWWKQNEQAAFYDDAAVFRSAR
jgi:Protein of unknown function (DUF3025)